ncbi:MAG TPA: site-specific integrase [Terriglobales bacterium]|nr:site-specific integrase [Terriglobales bacterium]
MLTLAFEWGLITRPVLIHELPGELRRERTLSFAEEARYLNVASSTLRDVTILGVDCGLRPNSELFPLKWENVHLKPAPDAGNGFIHIIDGKTKSAVRNIPLTDRAREVLQRRQQSNGSSPYVFPGGGQTGHLITVQHAHERASKKAGLEPFEFYCWRHTFGTRAAQAGVDRFALARLMGHSSPSVAERYYIHVSEQHVAAGFEKFQAYQKRNQIQAFPQCTTALQ